MKVCAMPNPSGSAFWRLYDPFKYLNRLGVETIVSNKGITREQIVWSDISVLQSCVDKEGIALLAAFQGEAGKKIVVDVDDFTTVDDDSPFKMEHTITQAEEVMKITIGIADLVTVTTPYLAEKIRPLNKNVVVLPNYLDLDRWDLPKLKNTSDRIRIGWAGSLTHLEDLKLLQEPLKRICAEFPQVQLVFCGDTRVADLFPGLPIETMLGVPFEAWPARLHGLRLDIGLAPLRDSEFNRCKSNIKWLEYSIAQVPGVYSPTVYQHRGFEPKFGLVANDAEGWYRAIKNLIIHPELRADIQANAYGRAKREYDLKRRIPLWKKAYASLLP